MHRWFALILLLVLPGCFGPSSVVLRVQSSPDLNPNDRGEPTPVDVRVYQLKNRGAFTSASFEDLWVKANQVLGNSVIGDPLTLTFEPQAENGPVSAHEVKLDPAASYLGLMGLFSAERKEGLEERKRVVSLEEAATLVIHLSGHRLVMIPPVELDPDTGRPIKQPKPEDKGQPEDDAEPVDEGQPEDDAKPEDEGQPEDGAEPEGEGRDGGAQDGGAPKDAGE